LRITVVPEPADVESAADGDVGLGEADAEADVAVRLPVAAGARDGVPSEQPAATRRTPVTTAAPRRRAGMAGTIGPPG